ALSVGLFGPLLAGMGGWRVQPAHFVERHGLIIIIAIGESLIAIGFGARGTGLGAGVIVGVVLGLVVVNSFWLAYFDFLPIRVEQLLTSRIGLQRTALARDVYTYLHLPMVAGIVLFAFAVKVTLAHVGRELDTIPALGLCGGPALYLLAYVALRLRVSRTLGGGRLVAAVACALLFPVAVVVPALVAPVAWPPRSPRAGPAPALVAPAHVAAVAVALHAHGLVWRRAPRPQPGELRGPRRARPRGERHRRQRRARARPAPARRRLPEI